MLDLYIQHGAQKLRCGYTTGSCAAGASMAAAEMLLGGGEVRNVNIMTPKGIALELEIEEISRTGDSVSCAVRKDSGDDPDITNGILVFSTVRLAPEGVTICGGRGIGKVTKDGLDRPKGEWAINSVPRKMIKKAVEQAAEKYDYHGGFSVEISVPDGEEIAKKTYNPRMGIIGGISIIGTGGIVEPMSSAALIDTIRMEGKMRRAEGYKNLIVTPGNYGESFLAEKMPYIGEKSVKCSNFIGEAIVAAMEQGFESMLIVGHIGKLVKLGAGIMNTHSAQADGRMEVLVTCGLMAGCDADTLRKIPSCMTCDAALEILKNAGFMEKTMQLVTERADYYLKAKVKGEIKIGAVMFSNVYGILGQTADAAEISQMIEKEYGNG